MPGISISGRIDKYGRFSIPKGIRDALRIAEGDLIEVEIKKIRNQMGEVQIL